MQIDLKEFGKTKLATIWLTTGEQKSCIEQLNAKIAELTQQKYRVFVMRSGKDDLLRCTDALLKCNLKA